MSRYVVRTVEGYPRARVGTTEAWELDAMVLDSEHAWRVVRYYSSADLALTPGTRGQPGDNRPRLGADVALTLAQADADRLNQ